MKDVNLMARRVTVRESVADVGLKFSGTKSSLVFVPPKNGKVRKVALPKFLIEPLTQQTAGRGPEEFVFPGAGSKPMRHGNFYGRHFKPAVRRTLPNELHGLRFHDLRHTCASLLIAQGANLVAICRQLGHSSIEITANRYGHLFPDELDRLADALDTIYEARTRKDDATVTALR